MEKPKKLKLKLDWKALMMIGSQKSITDTRAEPRHLSNDLSGMSLRSESIDGVVTFWDVTGMEHSDGRRTVRLSSRPHLAENSTENSQWIEIDVDDFNVLDVEVLVTEMGGSGPMFKAVKAPAAAPVSLKKENELLGKTNDILLAEKADLAKQLAESEDYAAALKRELHDLKFPVDGPAVEVDPVKVPSIEDLAKEDNAAV